MNERLGGASLQLPDAVAPTKLRPPRSRAPMVERERLMERLKGGAHKRCVVVQGPAGSGKTSLLARWRKQLLAQDIEVAWLTLGPDDGQALRFFCGLLACVADVERALVQEATQMLGRHGDALADEAWVIELVQRIAARRCTLVLMLDDVHHLSDKRAHSVLQWLLEYAPTNLRMCLASRAPLPVDLGRLRDQAQLEVLGAADLAFSVEETQAFLQLHVSTVSDRNVNELHALADGWIAGLQLLAAELKNGRFRPIRIDDAGALAAYFEAEVLAQVAAEDLETLMRCAVAQRVCASLSATLAGRPHAVAYMTMRLAALDRENLFVTQVTGPDQEVWYRVHPLLREVLLARLQARDVGQLPGLHRMACQWFHSRNCLDEAMRHALAAGEQELAADIVEQCAADMLPRGALSQLGAMLVLLPQSVVRKRFHLRLLVAQLRLYGRKLPAVEADVRELQQDAGVARASQRFALTLLEGGLAIQKDDSDAVSALQEALSTPPEDAPPILRVRAGHILSWLFANQGRYAQALALLDRGDRCESSPDRRLVTASFRGMTLALEGRMSEAERLLRQVLVQARSTPDIDPSIACVTAGLLCEPVYESNDLRYALQLAADQTTLLERAAIPDAVLRALLTAAAVHRLAGSQNRAVAALDRLEAYAHRHGLDRLLAHALAKRMRWCLEDGDAQEVQALLHRLEALAGAHQAAKAGTRLEIWRVTQRARARLQMHWNDFSGAEEGLTAVLQAAQSACRWREVAVTSTLLACTEQARGRGPAAFERLHDALVLGHRLGLMRSLLDACHRVRELIEALLTQRPPGAVIAFYAQRLLAAAREADALSSTARAAPEVQSSGQEALSRREHEVLTLAGQAWSNKKIARMLGVTPHTVKFHLGKVYLKLGVSRRDQAIARLRAQPLSPAAGAGLDAPAT